MRKAFEVLKNTNAHIPFVMNDGTELCHLKIGNLWKVHYFDGNEWKRPDLSEIPEDCVECQISGIRDEYGAINLSFICGYSKINRNFETLKLVWFKGRTFDSLRMIGQTKAISGFINDEDYAIATVNHVSFLGRKFKLKLLPIVYRLSYDPIQKNLLFMTIGNGTEFRSYMIKEYKGYLFVSRLLYKGNCLYKMCSFKNEIYFASKFEENRRIEEVADFNDFEAIPIDWEELFEEVK